MAGSAKKIHKSNSEEFISLIQKKIYLFIYSFIYLYPVKNSSGTINSNTMTNFLKPRNLSPNIILTYNMLLNKT